MPAFSRFLRYFMAVAQHGSIRRASDELHVSASAVDRQILKAEAEIGVPLFERLPSGLRLTAAGEILMSAGRRWQKGLVETRAQIEDLRGLRRGHVDIAVIDALATGHVPQVIAQTRMRYPGISVGVKVLDNLRVKDAILAGDVDFGVFLEPQTFRGLSVRAHADVVLGFVTPPGHPLGATARVRASACVGYPVVMPAEPLALCRQISVLVGVTGLEPAVAATTDNIQMIKSLVGEGVGVGLLTSLDVIAEVQAGTLNFTAITDTVLRPLTLALCVSTSRTLSSAAGVVLGTIEDSFDALAFRDPDEAVAVDQATARTAIG